MYGSVVVELVCSLDTEVFGDCDDSLVPPLLSPRRCLVSDSVGVVASVDVSLLGGATCCDVAADVVADADEDSERVGVDDEGADDDDVAVLVDEAVDVAEEDEGVDAWLDAWVELVVGSSVCRERVGSVAVVDGVDDCAGASCACVVTVVVG